MKSLPTLLAADLAKRLKKLQYDNYDGVNKMRHAIRSFWLLALMALVSETSTNAVAEQPQNSKIELAQQDGEYTIDESLGAQSSVSGTQQGDLSAIITDRILRPLVDGSAFRITIQKPITFQNSELYNLASDLCATDGAEQENRFVVIARIDLKKEFLREITELLSEVGTPLNLKDRYDICSDSQNKSCIVLFKNKNSVKNGSVVENWKVTDAWSFEGNLISGMTIDRLLSTLGVRWDVDEESLVSPLTLELQDQEGNILLRKDIASTPLRDSEVCTVRMPYEGAVFGYSSAISIGDYNNESFTRNTLGISSGLVLQLIVQPVAVGVSVDDIRKITLKFGN